MNLKTILDRIFAAIEASPKIAGHPWLIMALEFLKDALEQQLPTAMATTVASGTTLKDVFDHWLQGIEANMTGHPFELFLVRRLHTWIDANWGSLGLPATAA